MAAIRGIKNVVGNYSNGEIKVREATTNEPWGPTTAQLAEISDLCYQLLHFHEVMSMIEKRLNDKGKNYRHVAKALLVLDYVIKTGPDRVIQYWKDKLYIINTLKDFQFTDKEMKDQGRTIVSRIISQMAQAPSHYVRDRAKQITVLLNDNETLLLEREKALETKKKFHSGNLAPTSSNDTTSRSWEPERKAFQGTDSSKGSQPGSTPNLSADIKAALPTNRGEEDLQLQLALALSKQDDDKTQKTGTDEDSEYKKAIILSKETTQLSPGLIAPPPRSKPADPWASLPEPSQPVLHTDLGDPWGGTGSSQPPPPTQEPLLFGDTPEQSNPVSGDPWEGGLRGKLDSPVPAPSDPWGDLTSAPSDSPTLKPVNLTNEIVMGPDPWAESNKGTDSLDPLTLLDSAISPTKQPAGLDVTMLSQVAASNTIEEDFLGSSNAKLVNLDALVDLGRAPTPGAAQVGNPFAMLPPEAASAPAINPFMGHEPPQPTLNQMRDFSKTDPLPVPLIPSSGPPQVPQSSHESDLASLFQAPPVSNPLPNYNIPSQSMFPPAGPPAQTGFSGLGQLQPNQSYAGYPAGLTQNPSPFATGAYPPQMSLAPNQSAVPNYSAFATAQVSTGPPAYSAFQTAPTGPPAGMNTGISTHSYSGAPSLPQSSNPFF